MNLERFVSENLEIISSLVVLHFLWNSLGLCYRFLVGTICAFSLNISINQCFSCPLLGFLNLSAFLKEET